MIEQRNKWNIGTMNNSSINENAMMAWSQSNFYRTSYNDMAKKVYI